MALFIMLLSLFAGQDKGVHDFTVTSIDGKTVDLAGFKGKKMLLVNTASECGFTKQYAGLQALSEQYGDELVVIGFPANNFGGQEPGTAEEIQTFCEKNFGVTFLLAEKSSVKGDDISDLFQYLTTAENTSFTGEINWNFEKFLVDENGRLTHRFRSKVDPLSDEILTLL